jgi:hypothetical protein
MKKYLPPCEREFTSFPPRLSESLCSVDGTCTTSHASAGIETFQEKKEKEKVFSFSFFKKISIPLRLQHSYCGRRLCCNLGGIEMFQENKNKNKNK